MTPKDIRIGAVICTSNYEYLQNPDAWERKADECLAKELSYMLARERSDKVITEGRVEKRIDLYVASPDVFWKIVRDEAERIAIQFMPRCKEEL